MMRNIFFLLMLAGFAVGCHAQHQEPKEKTPETIQNQESPLGSWKVNKEFDENGNLIRYDSVYSWSSDGQGKALTQEEIDSLFSGLPSFFGQQGDPINGHLAELFRNDPYLKQFFGNDTTAMPSPFGTSPFGKWMMNDSLWMNNPDHDQIMEEMERMHRDFMQQFREQPLIPAERDTLRRF